MKIFPITKARKLTKNALENILENKEVQKFIEIVNTTIENKANNGYDNIRMDYPNKLPFVNTFCQKTIKELYEEAGYQVFIITDSYTHPYVLKISWKEQSNEHNKNS